MTKNARVEPGKTPSVASGAPSDTVKQGEAVCRGEKLEGSIVKTAKAMQPLIREN